MIKLLAQDCQVISSTWHRGIHLPRRHPAQACLALALACPSAVGWALEQPTGLHGHQKPLIIVWTLTAVVLQITELCTAEQATRRVSRGRVATGAATQL